MKTRMKKGFTLVEILIVVVILGILAAIVIPQFSSASQEASLNSLKSDLQTVRSQIQLYKIQHLGELPTDTNFEAWMMGYTTKANAWIGDDAVAAATTGAQGPYLQKIPTNPWGGSGINAIVPTDGTGQGWAYDSVLATFDAIQGSCLPGVADLTKF